MAVRHSGQIQTGGGLSAFTAQLCADVSLIIPCASLQTNVQSANTFGALNGTVQTDGNGNLTNAKFSPGTPGQNVLVQVAYNRPFMMPWVATYWGKNGSSLVVSSVAIQNEPYQ